MLRKAREEIRRQVHVVGPAAPAVEAAWDNLYRAEGSDWFWWFGDDFSSDNDAEFDLLFRTHLMNAYRAVDLEPPPQQVHRCLLCRHGSSMSNEAVKISILGTA